MKYCGIRPRLACMLVVGLLIASSCSSDGDTFAASYGSTESVAIPTLTAFQPQSPSPEEDPEAISLPVVVTLETPGFAPTAENKPAGITVATETSPETPSVSDEGLAQPEAPVQGVPELQNGEKPFFDRFVDSVKNGNSELIVGVHVENVLALRVVQQPKGKPAFVSPVKGVATEFLLAFEVAGNIGLLAHNYLSGALFFDLKPGDIVQLVYGDESVVEYEVVKAYEYQALNPLSPSSDFIDLNTGETVTAAILFDRMYGGEHHLTFQTCIDRDGNDSWGRLFVIAMPL